jgi:Carboxypeptidase regulatory-like domain
MTSHLLLALALWFTQQPPRDAAAGKAATPTVGTASISGIVVTDDPDRKPVRRARVSIMDNERRHGATVVTDESGRFTFKNVPAGRYSITPTKAAWVGTSYGATRPNRPGTPITVADGQHVDKLTIRLARGAVITGTVTDEYGRPMVRASVTAFRYIFQGGTRTPIPAGPIATTDDRGVFRIYGLALGQYLVGTSPRGATGPPGGELRQTTDAEIQRALAERGRGNRAPDHTRQDERSTTVAYAAVFYPGTTTVSQGSLISIAAGEERSGIDFQASLVPTSRVEGTVVLPDGGVAAAVSVNLVSSDGATPGFGFENFRVSRTSAEGRFLFSGLPSGRYTILSRAASPRDPPAPATPPAGRPAQPTTPSLWAMSDIVLDGQNVSGLTLTLQPGFTVSGRLDFKGTLAPPDVSRLRIQLMPITSPGQVASGVSPAVVNADGSFTMTGVTPGQYRVMAATPGGRPDEPGWVLMSAVVNGRDALDTPLELRQSVSDALLTFSDRPAELSGSLQDPTGRPAPDYYVLVFSSDRTHWTPQSRRVRAMRPSAEGRFTVRNLPAGDYLIAAVTDIEDGEWGDPGVLQQLSTVSMKLTLAEGEKKSQDIQVGAIR